MKRVQIPKRVQITQNTIDETRLLLLGFEPSNADLSKDWCLDAYYSFSKDDLTAYRSAIQELYQMCIELVPKIIRNNDFSKLCIPDKSISLIKSSWENQEPNLMLRFDLAINENGELKLIESNADCPSLLLEASILQADWQERHEPGYLQFNDIHLNLSKMLSEQCKYTSHIYCGSRSSDPDALMTTKYICETLQELSLNATWTDIEALKWDSTINTFTTKNLQPINLLIKTYPWEWMWNSVSEDNLSNAKWRVIQPPWSMLLESKGFLALLWQEFKGHPLLVPTFFEPPKLNNTYVHKRMWSRGGENILLVQGNDTAQAIGIYQEWIERPIFNSHFTTIGGWVIGNLASGIGVIEDINPIAGMTSRFVPHVFK